MHRQPRKPRVTVTVQTSTSNPRPALGPGDLSTAAYGATITVTGIPDRDRDFGLWSGAIGQAVLRGASVDRR